MIEIGAEVIWDDDGDLNHGKVETICPQSKGTGKGMYVCRFENEFGMYTRNFDDYSFESHEVELACPSEENNG